MFLKCTDLIRPHMARQGVSRPKVVSSGRITSAGRGHIYKKKVAGKSLPPHEPAYSLYSTDSEDQVTTIHKGLDRCAALLNGILEAEQAEAKPRPQGPKTTFKSKPKNLTRKTETDKKQHGKKTNKRPDPVQKMILSASSHPGFAGKSCCHGDHNPGIRGAQGSHDQSAGLASVTKAKRDQQHSALNSHVLSSGEVQTSTAFNCRLTTSTPALSPQRPDSAHSQPCSSKCLQSHSSSTQGFANPAQYSCSSSMAPAVHFQSEHDIPVEPGVPLMTGPVCDGPQVASSTGNLNCSSAVLAAEVPVQPHVTQPQPDTGGPPVIAQQQMCSSEESGTATSAEEDDEEEQEPVRDIMCQPSEVKIVDLSCTSKVPSPERTARRVLTVRYLLGELKTLVAHQDTEAVRLISEVEQSVSLLPAMVGSTNIQAEIALALQPLRSENAQLRRRLRILNQQLQGRERAERQARPVDCNMEVMGLQSLNFTLQTQLNETHGELEGLQQENMRLQKALENKEKALQQHKEERESENSRLRLEVTEALAEVQSCQSQLKECETEKTALTLSLQQREAEIHRLQEVIRGLQRNQTDVIKSPQKLDLPQLNSQLTRSVLELHENAQRETAASDKVSSSVQNYLQTLEDNRQVSHPHAAHCQTHVSQPALPCQFNGGRERIIPLDNKVCSPTVSTRVAHKPSLEAIAENAPQSAEQKITSFVPLRETSVVQLAAHDKPQCDGLIDQHQHQQDQHVGLKYKGGAFEKLGISAGLHNCPLQSQHARRCLRMGVESEYTGRPSAIDSTFSSCDIKSLASDWSINSWSTFNTRDEQNFRDGLAALDASIASLQKTLKADFNK